MTDVNTDPVEGATELEDNLTVETQQGELDVDGEEETVETEAEDGTETGDPAEVEAEADGETEEVAEEPTFEVETVNGKEVLPLSKLTESVMLKADHTKKTMALAEESKAVKALETELSQTKSQLTEALTFWAVPQEQEPDWDALANDENPRALGIAQVQWQKRMQLKEQAKIYHQQLQADEMKKAGKIEQEKLLEAFPEWKSPEVLKKQTERLVTGGDDYGFTENEVRGISDHRMIKVMDDALKYRELQKKQAPLAKKLSVAPKKLPAGARTNKSQEASKKLDAQLQNLRSRMQQGDTDAGVEYMQLKRRQA